LHATTGPDLASLSVRAITGPGLAARPRLSLRGVRHSIQRHYCGRCEHLYCLRHTRISPHGTFGSCGLDSKCLCLPCFEALSFEQQVLLEKTNRLRPAKAH
jgi:hypothetical protein